ncbi:MmyB family transcriptional regulator [Modestobacter excelsi]|uniref:MmyB family transcriptional regulator n=1 Tax=Modestobacter excelsi TaxID=2213161 RepID=UPI00110C97C2
MKNPHLEELGQFLRARRADVTPEALGLPSREAATRRVAGLRREEVADCVAISHDYYTRIEQGRLAPSEPVLHAIAETLRLAPDQREYVESLAQRAGRRTLPQRRAKPVRPQLQRLLDQLTETPAFIVGKYLDILAWNGLAAALLADVDKMPARERNYVRMVFTNQRVKDLYDDWEAMARTGVAQLRRQAADNPTDPKLAALVGELSVVSPTSSDGPSASSGSSRAAARSARSPRRPGPAGRSRLHRSSWTRLPGIWRPTRLASTARSSPRARERP